MIQGLPGYNMNLFGQLALVGVLYVLVCVFFNFKFVMCTTLYYSSSRHQQFCTDSHFLYCSAVMRVREVPHAVVADLPQEFAECERADHRRLKPGMDNRLDFL